jgi:hypothetical protein
LRLDALGIDEERVARLEALLRNELEQLTGKRLPTRRQIELAIGKTPLEGCSGETRCLAAIGKRLDVQMMVFGNVASLGDAYVMNIKVVDAAEAREIRRVESDPLRGNPDDLIESVRVAAYRLLAPERLLGSLAVLADITGASVEVDGKAVGQTPLKAPVRELPLGPHRLKVSGVDYKPFEQVVEVRFQKTTRVVVRLATPPETALGRNLTETKTAPPPPRRWYQKTWFFITVGVAAVAIGGTVGYFLRRDHVVDCTAMGVCR